MAGFLKKLFGGEEEAPPRSLNHPRELELGDIIKLGFIKQMDIANQEFEITNVSTYVYETEYYLEWTLKNKLGETIYLMVEEEDGEEYLSISKKLKNSEAIDLIGAETIANIRKNGNGFSISISPPENLDQWLVNEYTTTESNVSGGYNKADFRKEQNHNHAKFKSYLLNDEDEDYGIEIDVYNSNDLEICVIAYHDVRVVEEMWPKNN